MGMYPTSSTPSPQNSLTCSKKMDDTERLSACFQSAARAYGLGSVTIAWPGSVAGKVVCRPSVVPSGNSTTSVCSVRDLSHNGKGGARHAFRDFLSKSQDLLFPHRLQSEFKQKWALNDRVVSDAYVDTAMPLFYKVAPESEASSVPASSTDKRPWCIRFKKLLSPRTRSILLFNILTILYGSNAAVIKETESIMDPGTFSAIRFAIATLAFIPFLPRAFKDDKITEAGTELGILAGLGYLSQSIGLITTEAGRASFICAFTVIVVPLVAGLSGSHIPMVTWISAGAALFGIGLLESSGASPSIGDLWNFVSAVFFGVHMLRTEHFSRSLPSSTALPVLSLQLFVIAMLSGMWSISNHVNEVAPIHLQESLSHIMAAIPWLSLFYTGLISTAFCLWVELVAMREVSSTEAAVVYTLEPLWGAGFAWLFLGERWGPLGWLGAAFILGGSLTTQLLGRVGDGAASGPRDEIEIFEPEKHTGELTKRRSKFGSTVNKKFGKKTNQSCLFLLQRLCIQNFGVAVITTK